MDVADVDDLLTRLAKGLADVAGSGRPLPERLCRAAATLLGCDGGAITLAYTLVERVTLCATDDTALIIEETQDVVGQGPGHDAFSTGMYARFDLLDVDGPDPAGRCSSRTRSPPWHPPSSTPCPWARPRARSSVS